jgi:hypothetical protein
MRIRLRTTVSWALLGAWLLAGCGGGGSSTPAPCAAGGTLRALAVEGAPAPGTAGSFQGFPTGVPLSVAAGGWSAFVAQTDDPAAGEVLYAARPDGTLVAVWRKGEAVPDAGGGVIDSIPGAWVNDTGLVLAWVTITGDAGGRDFGLLTARVDAMGVSAQNDVVYDGRDLAATGLGGTLTGLVGPSIRLAGNGSVWFHGTTSVGQEGFWRANADGTGLALLVGTTTPLPGGLAVADLLATEVHGGGDRYVFLAERTDVGGTVGLYTGRASTTLLGLVAAEGDALGGGATIDVLPPAQALVPYESGSALFLAVSNLGEDHLLLGASGLPPLVFAVEGDPIVVAGAPPAVAGGTFGTLAWLRNASQSALPLFRANVLGASSGVTLAILAVTDTSGGKALALYDTRPAPSVAGAGVTFTSTFPDLGTAGRIDASADGAIAFGALLSNGATGVFWLIPNCGLFALALSGVAAPGGDTFAPTSAWAVTAAVGTVLFRAPLTTAGSGIFRQGP